MSDVVARNVMASGLPEHLKRTAIALALYADPDGNSIRPSVKTIAHLTERSERVVRRNITKLVAIGVLLLLTDRRGGHRSDGRGRSSVYHLNVNALPERVPGQRYNEERPHQALDMKVPADIYTFSGRPYRGLGELDYPLHDWAVTVTHCGRICFKRRKVNLSQVFAGQQVGVRQVDEHIWLVTFMHYDIGYFDDETCRLEPIDNPFGPTVLPMSPE
jgi:hypothetical protein